MLRDNTIRRIECRKTVVNICTRKPNWNGFDYCDVYSGVGLPCWKQDGKHSCVGVVEVKKRKVKFRSVKVDNIYKQIGFIYNITENQ